MSIRIHELAKKIGMDNKVLLALLKERKYDVKSVSSTIDNISAEALVEEMKAKQLAAPTPATDADTAAAADHEHAAEPKVKLPAVFVKSAQDIVREKAEKLEREKAEKAAAQPAVAVPPAPPAAPQSGPAPAPAAHSAPKAAPAVPAVPPPPVGKAPPSLPPMPPVAKMPPPVVPPVSKAPPSLPPISATPAPVVKPVPLRPAPGAASAAAPAPAPAPLRPAAPAAPLPSPAASHTHSSSPSPQPVASHAVSAPAPATVPASRPPTPPALPTPVSAPPSLPPIAKPPPAPMPPPLPPTAKPPPLPHLPAAASPTPASEPGEIKILHLKPPIVLRDFATALGLKPFKLISELMEMGIFASMTQAIDEPVAVKVAEKHGFILEIKHRGDQVPQQTAKDKEAEQKRKTEEEETKNLQTRPPVVCILGHVDHGKTSLLDAIRKANVAAGEAGGITQHIGAYQVEHNGKKITFLDTPGHAAFNKMRARGASVTDIAVLVVAADDGFMPQTDEALKHIQNAKVTLMVAVNKMDVKGANLDQVKAMMQQRGIAPEDWGGDTVTVPVSAIKGTGITDLLDMIQLQADVLELKANPKAEASGVIIESQLDVGRGPLATVIVHRGTLRTGDALLCGPHWCKVRAMFDDQGKAVKEAGPATPVRVIGWSGTPDSGATFRAVKNAREAENMAEEEQMRLKKEASVSASAPKEISVEKLFAEIAATQQKTLKVIVKTDVFGSSEAVRHVLDGIRSTKVQLEIVSVDVGLVTKNDVLMASTGGAVILGFNTKLENGVTPVAKHHGVRVETYSIIYELGDKVREMMADLLEPELKEVKQGAAEVRATFPLAKGFVAGCLVTEGKITRNALARLRRGKEIVNEGKIATLKRFKDDANEVRAGLECGIKLGDFNGYEVGDIVEVFEIQKVRPAL